MSGLPNDTANIPNLPPIGVLRFASFFSGGAVMVVEFTGNRLLAPGFGNSLYTWTALIGIILFALSCGDYVGGQLVDRVPKFALLAALFAIAGALTAFIPVLAPLLPEPSRMDPVGGPLLASLVLFFLPSALLASITPVSIRLLSKAHGDINIGKSAGTVGMASAMGGLTGTIVTTYLLIPAFGVRGVLLLLGLLLLGVGTLLHVTWGKAGRKPWVLAGTGIFGVFTVFANNANTRAEAGAIYEQDTFYHRIRVSEETHHAVVARVLRLDTTLEGGQAVASGALVFPYQGYWRLAEIFCPELESALFLGAGAFGMPEQLSRRFPAAQVDVAEIDPEVIEAGRRFFRLGEYPRVRTHAVDARRFLTRSAGRYDFIFADAYDGVQNIPAHLVTREFFVEAREHLTPGGVFAMNVVGSLTGAKSEFYSRVLNGLRLTFPRFQVFGASTDPTMQQNLIIVVGRTNLDSALARLAEQRSGLPDPLYDLSRTRLHVQSSPPGSTFFTDDHNPVEYVIARQLRSGRQEIDR